MIPRFAVGQYARSEGTRQMPAPRCVSAHTPDISPTSPDISRHFSTLGPCNGTSLRCRAQRQLLTATATGTSLRSFDATNAQATPKVIRGSKFRCDTCGLRKWSFTLSNTRNHPLSQTSCIPVAALGGEVHGVSSNEAPFIDQHPAISDPRNDNA